jgi:membrane protein DedA with SNARE-associated domain
VWEFMAANALGAILWSTLIALQGYAAGQAVVRMLGSVAGIEKVLLALAVVAIIAAVVVRAVVRRRAQRITD